MFHALYKYSRLRKSWVYKKNYKTPCHLLMLSGKLWFIFLCLLKLFWFYSFLFVLSIHVDHCILINKQPLTCPCHLYSSFLHLEIFCWYSFYLLTCTCIDTCIILKITVWTFNFLRHSYNHVLLNFFCIWRPYNSWIVFNMNYNLHACKYMYHTCVWVAVCWLAIDFQIHALITGPFDTPYEGGFFYFVIRCPPDYPIRAPRVKLMTTGDNQVRFNPNLYKNGKVCLSILGYVMS